MNSEAKKNIVIIFLFLLFSAAARIFCLKFCINSQWYQLIVNDKLHHYQLGMLLVAASFLFLKKRKKVRNVVLSLAIAMIIDESVFLLPTFGITAVPYNHIRGVIFEYAVFLLYVYLLLKTKLKKVLLDWNEE